MSKNQASQNEQSESCSSAGIAQVTSLPKCRNCIANKSSAQHLAALNNLTLSVSNASASSSATSINQDETQNAVTPTPVETSCSNTSNCSTSNCCCANQAASGEATFNFASVDNLSSIQIGSIVAKNKANFLSNLNQSDLEQLANFANTLVNIDHYSFKHCFKL
jgi:hypothetical protein